MKKYFAFLIFILTMISGTCFAQKKVKKVNDNIDFIELEFIPNERSDYREVTVKLKKMKTIKGEVTVQVKIIQSPIIDEEKLKTLKKDTVFYLKNKEFDDLLNEVVPILNKTDVTKHHKGIGFHGTWCTIEYGNFFGRSSYKFWTPESDTEKRGLTDFLKITKKIIEIGGLNPGYFFPEPIYR